MTNYSGGNRSQAYLFPKWQSYHPFPAVNPHANFPSLTYMQLVVRLCTIQGSNICWPFLFFSWAWKPSKNDVKKKTQKWQLSPVPEKATRRAKGKNKPPYYASTQTKEAGNPSMVHGTLIDSWCTPHAGMGQIWPDTFTAVPHSQCAHRITSQYFFMRTGSQLTQG